MKGFTIKINSNQVIKRKITHYKQLQNKRNKVHEDKRTYNRKRLPKINLYDY